MFGKSDLINSLSRDLSSARDKRDTLASHVTTLTAQIAELEARLSAENDRREHERVVGEIEGIKERLRDFYLAFAHAIAGMRDASVSARAIVPEAPELSNLLIGVATEVANTVDNLLGDLDRRIEALRASQAAPQLPQSLNGSSELPQNSDRVLRLPGWLPRREHTKRKQLKISAAQQQPERRPCDLRLDHETVVVAYSDLSAPAAADIHGPAAAGKNARLVFWISNNIISQYSRADVFL
jgi:septal ring factor EnvC (AmiA/AmiB activator)